MTAARAAELGIGAEGALVGRRYHVPRFPLDPAVCARFARTVGADPARLGPHAHPCVVARPALAALDALLADPGLGAERSAMLHAGSDIRWHRPLVPGGAVELDAEVVDAGAYGNRRGLVVATRVAEPGGAALVDMQTVLAFAPPALPAAEGRPPLPTDHAVGVAPAVGSGPGGSAGAGPADAGRARRPVPGDDGATAVVRPVGQPVAERTVHLDDGFPARYAAASGDTNPIHLDADAARAAGLSGVVLHGLSTVALGVTFALDELAGGAPAALRRLRVRFARPGRPGRTARYAAHRSGGAGRFALSCRVGDAATWRHAFVEVHP